YVEEASIGDVLSIQVKQITTAGTGVFAVRPETGVPGQDINKPEVRVLEVNENQVHLDDRLKLPLHPVIGSMGVAAKHGEIETVYPGRHGGNMDTLEITTGSRVYLPVQVNGALLSLGDVKACVGDGQIAGSGVEVEAEVTLRVDTLPGGRFSWPRVESKGEWITITSASTVDQAARLAITEMVKWISQDKGLDFDTAYALVSLGGSLRVSQWGNPLTTARMVFPKRLINKLKSVPAASGRLNYRVLPPAANGDAEGETVAAETEQPAGRSSRRSGSGRSQRGSGRSRQSGGRRGTRQKSNGAPAPASSENDQKDAANEDQQVAAKEDQQVAARDDQQVAAEVDRKDTVKVDRKSAGDDQQAVAEVDRKSAGDDQQTAAEDSPKDATGDDQQVADRNDQQAAAKDDQQVAATEKRPGSARGKRGGQAGRGAARGNGHRRTRGRSAKKDEPARKDESARKDEPVSQKDPSPVQSDAGAVPVEAAPAARGGKKDAVKEPAENAAKASDSRKEAPQAAGEAAQDTAPPKPTFGRRQRRTVRRS
ncbi:MAG: acetamidase/formamidase family protein, partial [candidate division Zixibacteria bacterium]|nr:acetamidase/formamidase family protein [candidate division Zixibacteria bacterium]